MLVSSFVSSLCVGGEGGREGFLNVFVLFFVSLLFVVLFYSFSAQARHHGEIQLTLAQ